ncbi:MAG: ATP-binding cassette domain-containing protein [Bacilli bacterium]|nr:ATP-binding cassette domain-containing protein [Bacilli bacterium]
MNDKLLSIKNLNKTFNVNEPINVLININIDIFKGEFISIVGTSGCGKSTLLNIIANLDKESSGYINYFFDNTDSIGYMMQEAALFPWLNVEKNALFAAKMKNINNNNYIDNLLKKYGLYEFKYKYPSELSGGMKQRLSLIRTLGLKPKLLLLDEPFSQLDYQSRISISSDVYKLAKENNITTILVTHDISEAISLSDRIIVLSKRPAHIKNIYSLQFDKNLLPIERRKEKLFLSYYELIGKDLDMFEN